MSLKRVQIPSPNHSSRKGAAVRLIVLHTAEGALSIESLGSFFASPASQVSSHCGADDTPNTVGEYVQPAEKAWTVAAFNPISVNLELCAFASWTTSQWMQHPHMLANCAAWIREEAKRFDIPIVKLSDAEAQGSGRGVCQHSNLGVAGGGHHDCGPGFPIDHVLDLARASKPKPKPKPPHQRGKGVLKFSGTFDLETMQMDIHGDPADGPITWEKGPVRSAVQQVSVKLGGETAGRWSHKPLPFGK
jgi:hypothetical protein